MSHWNTPAFEAERALGIGDYQPACNREIVDTVLNVIAEPDLHMLVAGAAELQAAFPNQIISKQFRVDLAGKIWRSMFDRVRR